MKCELILLRVYFKLLIVLTGRIMRLFEAGIIGKITVAEYERMFGSKSGGQFADETVESTKSDDGVDATGKAKKSAESSEKLQPMNLRMLQGAFLALGFGHSVGGKCYDMVFEGVLNTNNFQQSYCW